MADFAAAAITDSPLSDRQRLVAKDLTVEEIALTGKITLRGRPEDKAFMTAAKKVLGAALPVEPMTSVQTGDLRIFWVAFDEWLIWTPVDGQTSLIADLRTALAGRRSAVVDVSDYYTVIRVSGDLSRDLLSKGCLVDLHPKEFPEGMATGTGFHHATLFITRDKGDAFDVMIRWSYADYLWNYLMDGAREWVG